MPYMAQHILHGPSGLPEDRYVNTFNFVEDVGTVIDHAAAAVAITNALQEFYTTDYMASGTAGSLQGNMPAWFDDLAEVRVYNWDDAQPRPPLSSTYAFAGSATQALPSEVALCLSYYANRNIVGRRGRIYIGPLTTGAVEPSGIVPARPKATLMDLAGRAGAALAAGTGSVLKWCVLSRRLGVATWSPITDGWVDDSFDTQRRRGEAATTRDTWTVGA